MLNTTSRIRLTRVIPRQVLLANVRHMRTVPIANSKPMEGPTGFGTMIDAKDTKKKSAGAASKWAPHSLSFPLEQPAPKKTEPSYTTIDIVQPKRRSRADRYKATSSSGEGSPTDVTTTKVGSQPATVPAISEPVQEAAPTPAKAKKKRTLRPRKALITLLPSAVEHLRELLDQPEPQHIRIGVRNRGCSGLTYHLEYVTEGGKFDELVEQDGVKVLIDSKALFLIVGLQMDWLDDKLSSRFIFRNPNSKGTCGCGESFMV
jgi:iron-sulfur cluster assembly accessory protein